MDLDNVGVGSVVDVNIHGEIQTAEVIGLGEKNNTPVIDFIDDKESQRWAYLDQITEVIKY